MGSRITKSTEFLRHDFTMEERLEMGTNLAQAHNRLAQIEEEEQVMKAQIKDKKAGVEQSVGTLSRNLSTGFEMQNIVCEWLWDTPNIGEVSYRRADNGEIAKTRPMSEQERQLDLPLEEPATEKAVEESVTKSEAAAADFFKTEKEETEDEPADPRPSKSGPAELQAFHEAELEKEVSKKGRGKGKKSLAEEF